MTPSPRRYRAASARPLGKITAATLAGAVTVLIAWLARVVWQVEIPAEVQAAITTLIAALAGYLTPLLPGEIVSDEQEQ